MRNVGSGKFRLERREKPRWRRDLPVVLLLGAAMVLQGPTRTAAQTAPPPLPPPVGPYRISGIVVSARSGSPLARASVQIQDAKNQQSTRTITATEDGRFEFRVVAGKFALQAARHGFITSYYNAHGLFSTGIVTGAGPDTEHLVLRLPPEAVLSGKVLDEAGEPLRGADVRLYRQDRSTGISRIVPAQTANTDDQGVYEASALAEGTYFVAVRAHPWYAVHPVGGRDATTVDRSLDVAYPVTYYGDATQADEATPIPVRGGDHLEADIHLSPVPAVHLTFRADDQHVESPMVQAPTFDGFEDVEGADVNMVSPGLYEMNGLAPGRYLVRLPDSSGQAKEPVEMDLTSGEELDSSSSRSVSTIKATVHVRGAAKLPDELQLALRPVKGKLMGWERVNEKGEAEFSDVAPGRYDLLAATNDKAFAVVRIASVAGEASSKSLDVPAGAVVEIAVTVVGGASAVEGIAKRNGKPVAAAMIVLVPKDPEANHERFRRDQSDLDGTFALPNVIPGSYTVIAIDDGWDLDWANPAVLAPYLPHGQAVTVEEKARGPVHLSTPIEVQKR